jgi:hypothetical protein
VRVSFSTGPDREDDPVLGSATASRLRMLLAVLAGTIVLVPAVVAAVLMVDAVTAGSAAGEGAAWGAVY